MSKESTALVLVTPEEQAYLDSLNTGGASDAQAGPTRLVINTKSKDADGVKRVIGSWHLEGTDKYYDGVAVFRPVRKVNKLISYSSDDGGKSWNFNGESVYFNDFRDEILDSKGGLAFGRKFGKALRELPEADQKANKELAGAYLDIFGLVTFGENAPVPCMFRTRGGKSMVINQAFESVPKDKKYSQYTFGLEAYQETDEKTKKTKDYWSVKATPDMSQVLPITPILGFDKEIVEFIRETNHNVLEQHKAARNKLEDSSGGVTAKVIHAEIFDDSQLPF